MGHTIPIVADLLARPHELCIPAHYSTGSLEIAHGRKLNDCSARSRALQETGAGNGWRPAARLRKSEPVEGAKTNRTDWRSPMKPQDAGNQGSSVDQRRRTRNPFDVVDVPNPNDQAVLEFATVPSLRGPRTMKIQRH